jgi:hypothetical protein
MISQLRAAAMLAAAVPFPVRLEVHLQHNP